MSNAVAIRQSEEVSRYDDPEMIKTIKETVCRGATEHQFRMFIEICKGTGLNPFLREIWYVPNVGVMAARDGYLRVANEHPMFDGIETSVERDEKGVPIKATCSVYRKDRSHPVTCEAYYSEYKKNGNVWNTYPSAMISKVAEVLALKRSFSINGVVSEEEIGFEAPREKTRKEKIEDAQAVAKRKIEEMKKAPAPVAVEPEENIIEAQTEDPPPIPPEESVNFGKMMESFQAIKAEFKKLGHENVYYEVLGTNGFEKSNQIRPVKLARPIYKEMAARLKDIREAMEREGA